MLWNQIRCPSDCCKFSESSGVSPNFIRFGSYRRKVDGRTIRRYQCKACRKTFSAQTFNDTYWQHKPKINSLLFGLFASSVSIRRSALLVGVDKKTSERRFRHFAKLGRKEQALLLTSLKPLDKIQADEMETFEHTRLKPLSIPMVVCTNSRRILAFDVATMPCKGSNAELSRRKYGLRLDQRKEKFQNVLKTIKPLIKDNAVILTDKKSTYPNWIYSVFPRTITHLTTKGRRGCTVGYGELKEGGFDPLFQFNHTAAMNRDNINRMRRRTWATTKDRARLLDHLYIYACFHNRYLV